MAVGTVSPPPTRSPGATDRPQPGTVLTALGLALAAVGSLAAAVTATWVLLALQRAHLPAHAPGRATHVLVALVATVLAPLLLAWWRHPRDRRAFILTSTYTPLLWNMGGLVLAAWTVPDLAGQALREQGAWVAAARYGESATQTRVLSALAHHAADAVDPAGALQQLPGLHALPEEVDTAHMVRVPFSDAGSAILMDVTLEGPAGTVTAPYLFDTGASFTTVSREHARALGLTVPQDAPTLEFNTAAGPRTSKMAFLPALHVGDVRVPGLLVSVCDACVTEQAGGLLGLNVVREFFVQMDYKNAKMALVPRHAAGPPNRAYDVRPVLDMKIEGSPEVWLGRVHWVVIVRNRGSVPVRDVRPVIRFVDGPDLPARPIDVIAPGAVARTLVRGKVHERAGEFTIELEHATW